MDRAGIANATIRALPGRSAMTNSDQVDYVSGRTRLFAIVGHPIEQVRSPEMITAELVGRGHDAVLVPMHVLPDDFDACLPQIMRVRNLGGLVFTIPFKVRACALADDLLPQAHAVGAINALCRGRDGRWRGEMFDGLGCVEAFRRHGLSFRDRRVMLLGAGGAGSAIAMAVGFERPASLTLFDIDGERAALTAARVAQASPGVDAHMGPPRIADVDILLNASPVGMLDDARLPFPLESIPRETIVFDAIVKPERTPLVALAERCGCVVVRGREMMRGQIARMVDFFYAA
jgi:shikimate dehydrogenase